MGSLEAFLFIYSSLTFANFKRFGRFSGWNQMGSIPGGRRGRRRVVAGESEAGLGTSKSALFPFCVNLSFTSTDLVVAGVNDESGGTALPDYNKNLII